MKMAGFGLIEVLIASLLLTGSAFFTLHIGGEERTRFAHSAQLQRAQRLVKSARSLVELWHFSTLSQHHTIPTELSSDHCSHSPTSIWQPLCQQLNMPDPLTGRDKLQLSFSSSPHRVTIQAKSADDHDDVIYQDSVSW